MKFRVADIAYPFALFASSVGAFGFGRGLLAFLMVAVFWLAAFKQPRSTLIEWIVVVGVMIVLLSLLLPALDVAREQSRVAICRNNLHCLAKSLQFKMRKDGFRLPQAVIGDESGKPLHSWRVSILPHLEQQSLYDKYDWTEPWDGPNNQSVSVAIDAFTCYSDPSAAVNLSRTNYFAIVGSDTAWPNERGLSIVEITDGPQNTILLLEAFGLDVPWNEPRDLSFDEAVDLLTGRTPARLAHHHHDNPGYFYLKPPQTSRGVHAAFAGGSVRFLPVPLPREMAAAMLTANADDHFDWDEFERLTAPQLDYAKIYATIAFAIVALWPARRAFRKRPA